MNNPNYIHYYPAILTETDSGYKVRFIDFDLTVICKSLVEAIRIAEKTLESHIIRLFDFPALTRLPKPTHDVQNRNLKKYETVLLIKIDILECRKKYSSKSVRKNVTVPSWLCNLAEKNNINFSQILQEALKKELGID